MDGERPVTDTLQAYLIGILSGFVLLAGVYVTCLNLRRK